MFLTILLVAGCTSESESLIESATTLECTMLHTGYTGDELQGEVSYYEDLSRENAELSVSFYRATDLVDDWWEIVAPISAFQVVSWEVVHDDWIDIHGDPLNEVVFAVDLSIATVDEGVESFFNEEGVTELEEGEDVWFHVWSTLETSGFESLSMYLFAYGYEDEDGSCSLF